MAHNKEFLAALRRQGLRLSDLPEEDNVARAPMRSPTDPTFPEQIQQYSKHVPSSNFPLSVKPSYTQPSAAQNFLYPMMDTMPETFARTEAQNALQGMNSRKAAHQKDMQQQKTSRLEDELKLKQQQAAGFARAGMQEQAKKAREDAAQLERQISDLNHVSALQEGKDFEQRQYYEMMVAGGTPLVEEFTNRYIQLRDNVDKASATNPGVENNGAWQAAKDEYNQWYSDMVSRYGEETVDRWIKYGEMTHNRKATEAYNKSVEAAAKNDKFGTSLLSVPLNLASGLGYLDVVGQKADNFFSGKNYPIDYNTRAQRNSQTASNIRGAVSEDMSGVGSFFYNTTMSLLDSATLLATGNVGAAMLGGAAATNAMHDAVQRGASTNQALGVGLIAAVAEGVLEKASIDKLFNLKNAESVKDIVWNVLKQAGAEGTEEGLTNLVNTIADGIIMGDKSQIETMIRNYMAEGYSEQQASGMAIAEWAKGLGLDVLGGALSGGLFSGAKIGFDALTGNYSNTTTPTQPTSSTSPVATQTTMDEDVAAAMAEMKTPEQRIAEDLGDMGADGTVTPTARQPVKVTPVKKTTSSVNTENVGDMGAKPATGAADYGFSPYSRAQFEYGTIKPGETPARVVDVPKSMDGKTKVMQTVRTIMEADATPDAAIPELENAIVDGEFSKMPITDQQASDRAEATIRRVGYQTALGDWMAEVRNGKVSKDSVVVGETLYNAAVNAGDTKSAVKIAIQLATQTRSAAQALQAIRMLKKMSPAAQLYGVKQSVDNLQKTLTDKYGSRAPDLIINEKLAAKLIEAETTEARKAAEEALYKDIARQIPATFADKWNAWRYLSMLGNVRTHARNILGNAMFAPVRFLKNKVGAGIEAAAQGMGIIDQSQRTKAFGAAGKELMDAAKADYANVEQQIMSSDKYNSASDIINKNRTIFKTKAIETLRKGNSDLLETEDRWFTKSAYASSLASFLKARGYTASDFTGDGMTQAQKDEARAYAIREAQKATYRDINKFSEFVSSIGIKAPGDNIIKRGVNAVIEGTMPFKNTPANILARSVEYSPVGLAKALFVDSFQVANGKITAAEYMDRLSSGLTGTALFGLGCLLSNLGILRGGTPEDEEQYDLEGRQPYSLEIGNTSITLDWLAPEAMPVFMGVELVEAIKEGGGDAAFTDKFMSFLNGLSGPMLEMSMMSSLQDALESTEYADNKVVAFMANGALGYLKQGLPTLFGQLERALGDPVRETTFRDKGNKILGTDVQYAIASAANKVPLLEYNQIPYIDAWGRTEDVGGVGTRLFNNLLNPAYVSKIQETPVDVEIKRLEEVLDGNWTPSRAESVITVNGRQEILTAKEFVTYAQAKGQDDLTFRQNLIDSDAYKGLDDQTKAKAMEKSAELSNVLAMQEAGFKPKLSGWQEDLVGADIETITDTLIAKAVESQLGSGANKYGDINELLGGHNIDDEIALALLTDTQYKGYNDYCKSVSVPVSSYVRILGIKNTNGKKQSDVKAAIEANVKSNQQKVAIWCALYAESTVPKEWK